MVCPEYSMFYIDDTLLSPEVLEEVYNKLPAEYKNTLVLREGEVEVGGFKQFLSFYSGKKLKFRNKLRAEDMFLTIFLDNTFILEQIKKIKEANRQISDIDRNWKTTTMFTNNVVTEGSTTLNQSTSDKGTTEDTQKTLSLALSSDSNSSGLIESTESKMVYVSDETEPKPLPENIQFPINSLNKNSNLFTDRVVSENNSVLINMSKSSGKDIATSRTDISNASEDWRVYMVTEIPELRKKFWGKFSSMFLF